VRCLLPLALVFSSSLPAADELLPTPSVAIDPRSLPSVPADELRPLPFSTDIFGDIYNPTHRPAAEVVRNSRILDPTGELLAPYLAAQLLDGKDYVEWCLRWNRNQYTLASQRAVPPRKISGWVTERWGSSWYGTVGGFHRHSGRQFQKSTTTGREQVWYVGGHGGGPVTIFNPFVAPQKVRD
jgi:hypothetical protein